MNAARSALPRGVAIGGGLLGLAITVGLVAYLLLGRGGGSGDGGNLEQMIDTRDLAERNIWEAEVKRLLMTHESLTGAFPEYLEDLEGLRVLPPGWEWEYDSARGAARIVRSE